MHDLFQKDKPFFTSAIRPTHTKIGARMPSAYLGVTFITMEKFKAEF